MTSELRELHLINQKKSGEGYKLKFQRGYRREWLYVSPDTILESITNPNETLFVDDVARCQNKHFVTPDYETYYFARTTLFKCECGECAPGKFYRVHLVINYSHSFTKLLCDGIQREIHAPNHPVNSVVQLTYSQVADDQNVILGSLSGLSRLSGLRLFRMSKTGSFSEALA